MLPPKGNHINDLNLCDDCSVVVIRADVDPLLKIGRKLLRVLNVLIGLIPEHADPLF